MTASSAAAGEWLRPRRSGRLGTPAALRICHTELWRWACMRTQGIPGSVMPVGVASSEGLPSRAAALPDSGRMLACSAERTGVQIHKMRLPGCMQWGWQGRCRRWEIDIWTPRVGVFMLSQSFGGGVGEATVPEEVLPASSSLVPTFPCSPVPSPPHLHPRGKQRRPLWVQGPAVTCFEITTTACQVLGEGRAG